MELPPYVIQRRVGRVAQLEVQRLLGTLERETHIRYQFQGRRVAEVVGADGLEGGVGPCVRRSRFYGGHRRGGRLR